MLPKAVYLLLGSLLCFWAHSHLMKSLIHPSLAVMPTLLKRQPPPAPSLPSRIPPYGPHEPLCTFLFSVGFFHWAPMLSWNPIVHTLHDMIAEAESHLPSCSPKSRTHLVNALNAPCLTLVSITHLIARLEFSSHPFYHCLQDKVQLWWSHQWVKKWEFKLRFVSKA